MEINVALNKHNGARCFPSCMHVHSAPGLVCYAHTITALEIALFDNDNEKNENCE